MSGGSADFSALGRLITLGLFCGGTTMKMISKTSMTSMYGTTLMSDLSLRPRPPRRLLEKDAMTLSG